MRIGKCYNTTSMWQGWLDDPKSFVKWYLEHYYECGDEEMDVDKDLFGDGSGMYHPDFCCILPKGLNTLQERIDRNSTFVESFLVKKEAEREAGRKAAEEKHLKAEREQNFLNGIQKLIDFKDESAVMIARANKMLKADEEKRKEDEEKMAWYKKQERKG